MSAQDDYWIECVSQSAEDCGAILTKEQIAAIAADVQSGHENYGLAFYSPPASDRVDAIEEKWSKRCDELRKELAEYQAGALKAVRRAYRMHSDANIAIHKNGDVETFR